MAIISYNTVFTNYYSNPENAFDGDTGTVATLTGRTGDFIGIQSTVNMPECVTIDIYPTALPTPQGIWSAQASANGYGWWGTVSFNEVLTVNTWNRVSVNWGIYSGQPATSVYLRVDGLQVSDTVEIAEITFNSEDYGAATTINIFPSTVNKIEGETGWWNAVVLDSSGNGVQNETVNWWTSDTAVLSFNSSVTYTTVGGSTSVNYSANGSGSANISANCDSLDDYGVATVNAAFDSITIDPTVSSVNVGDTIYVTVNLSRTSGYVDGGLVIFSSTDNSVCSTITTNVTTNVSGNAYSSFLCNSPGTCNIVASYNYLFNGTYNLYTAIDSVNVSAVPTPTTVTANVSSVNLDISDSIDIGFTVLDQYSNPSSGVTISVNTSPPTYLSVNNSYLTTNVSGVASFNFTAVSYGSGFINASVNPTLQIPFVVNPPDSTFNGVTLSPTITTVQTGNTKTFTATAYDQYSIPMQNVELTFNLSNPTPGTIDVISGNTDALGKLVTIFTANLNGTTLLTVADSANTHSAYADIIVADPYVPPTGNYWYGFDGRDIQEPAYCKMGWLRFKDYPSLIINNSWTDMPMPEPGDFYYVYGSKTSPMYLSPRFGKNVYAEDGVLLMTFVFNGIEENEGQSVNTFCFFSENDELLYAIQFNGCEIMRLNVEEGYPPQRVDAKIYLLEEKTVLGRCTVNQPPQEYIMIESVVTDPTFSWNKIVDAMSGNSFNFRLGYSSIGITANMTDVHNTVYTSNASDYLAASYSPSTEIVTIRSDFYIPSLVGSLFNEVGYFSGNTMLAIMKIENMNMVDYYYSRQAELQIKVD